MNTRKKQACEPIFHWFFKVFKTCQSKTLPELQNAAQRTSHRLSWWKNVITKRPFLSCFLHKLRFVIFHVLSQFEFLSFVIIFIFELCHNLSFVIIWVVQFCHNLSSHLEFFFKFFSSQFYFFHNLI